MKNVLLTGYNKPIADSKLSQSFSTDQIVSDEKSNDKKSFRIVKLIGP